MATLEEIQQKKTKLRGMLRDLDGLTKGQSPKADIDAFRAKQRAEKNAMHKAAAVYVPTPTKKAERRWLQWGLGFSAEER